jgi:hypothetical protein
MPDLSDGAQRQVPFHALKAASTDYGRGVATVFRNQEAAHKDGEGSSSYKGVV